MSVDPQVQGILDMLASMQAPDFADCSVPEAREFIMAFVDMQGDPAPMAEVRELAIPGPDGNQIPARAYRPQSAEDLPVIVYFHGGGWVVGNLDVVDTPCRQLAAAAGAVVVSVDYRLAPEHKAPAAAEDAYAAIAWVAANPGAVGGDSSRLGVGGDSAGGSLSAGVTLMARDRGGPSIAVQLLIYPSVDLAGDYPSRAENAEGYLLTARSMAWFINHYLDKPDDANNPYLSPIRADHHADLPPAFVITAGFDPLRDEGKAYADALAAAGGTVEYAPNPTMIHGFMWVAGVVDHTSTVYDRMAAFAKQHL